MPMLSPSLLAAMRCPACGSPLLSDDTQLSCTGCPAAYPVLRGIPVVIDETRSVFNIADYVRDSQLDTPPPRPSWLRRLRSLTPSIGANWKSAVNYQRYAQLITEQHATPRVLVLGGRILGQGSSVLADDERMELVETDVALGPRVRLICDAHDIPFAAATFDGVVIQAVLEHVCDPVRCVEEIHRVLKPGGLVYAETPFMQQVHGLAWDFTRFTDLGHRRLFCRFNEIDRGACCGPGMALAWSIQYFLLSFSRNARVNGALRVFSELTTWWLKHLDRFILDTPGSQDAASGYYFLGRRSEETLTDRELLKLFRGNPGTNQA